MRLVAVVWRGLRGVGGQFPVKYPPPPSQPQRDHAAGVSPMTRPHFWHQPVTSLSGLTKIVFICVLMGIVGWPQDHSRDLVNSYEKSAGL